MSIPNNNPAIVMPTTSNSLSVFIPPAVVTALRFLSDINSIFNEIRTSDRKILISRIHANMKAAEAAAEKAKQEANKDAASTMWGGGGGIAEGVFTIGCAGYMKRNTDDMTRIENKITKAEEWKKALKVNKTGSVADKGFNFTYKNEAVELNVVNRNSSNATERAEFKTKLKAVYERLQSDQARDIDTFAGNIKEIPQKMTAENITYEEIMSAAQDDEERKIEANINKYISAKKKELSDLANGGSRSLTSQQIQGFGKLLSGLCTVFGGTAILAKAQIVKDKALDQTYIELARTVINQFMQNINSISQQQLNIFDRTLLGLGAIGMMPS
ncbi:MAG: hypothetical protein AAF443_01375 [Chlamydiota bacterium]